MATSTDSTSTERRRRSFDFLKRRKNRNQATAANPPVTEVPSPTAPEPLSSAKQRQAPENSVTTTTKRVPVGNWLCRTRLFRKICASAFDMVDVDGSGSVDEKELYSGLLLIHLKLGCYAGPAACRPLGREKVAEMFRKFDADQSGCLDRDEFQDCMALLFGNVLLRVIAQWSLTLIIVPLVAGKILEGIVRLYHFIVNFIADLDKYSSLADFVEVSVELALGWITDHTPHLVFSMIDRVYAGLDKVPDSIWSTIPLTLVSTLLGIALVPWMIFQIDDAFQRWADRRTKGKNKED